jgi:hypothetical protein
MPGWHLTQAMRIESIAKSGLETGRHAGPALAGRPFGQIPINRLDAHIAISCHSFLSGARRNGYQLLTGEAASLPDLESKDSST